MARILTCGVLQVDGNYILVHTLNQVHVARSSRILWCNTAERTLCHAHTRAHYEITATGLPSTLVTMTNDCTHQNVGLAF